MSRAFELGSRITAQVIESRKGIVDRDASYGTMDEVAAAHHCCSPNCGDRSRASHDHSAERHGTRSHLRRVRSSQRGSIMPFPAKTWHRLALSFQGTNIEASIDDAIVVKVQDSTHLKGMAGIGCDWNAAEFDNFHIGQKSSKATPTTLPERR